METFTGSRQPHPERPTTFPAPKYSPFGCSGSLATRILIYSHDTFGLGNIRRMLAIAEHLVERDPDAHVLLISGSPMLHGFRLSPRIDFIKLPCLTRDCTGKYQVRSLPMQRGQLLTMRARLIHSAVQDFQPDLLLVDKKPLGVEGELTMALAGLDDLPHRPAVALVLRDILDTPDVTRRIWTKHDYHSQIKRYYDLVLVAGQPDIFDVADAYRFPESTRRRLRYCGYIQRGRLPAFTAKQADSPHILVSVGGGGDGEKPIRAFIEGTLSRRASGWAPRARIFTGPEMAAETRAALVALASGQPGIEIHEFSDSMENEIATADLVVCMCGYNTICEVLAAGKRVVAIPRVEPVQEQWIRAQRFAERGLLTVIHPDKLNAASLMSAIDAALKADTSDQSARLDFKGLERIQYWLQRLLAARRRPPRNHFADFIPIHRKITHA